MRTNIRYSTCVLFIACLSSTSISAQDVGPSSPENDAGWVSAAIGPGDAGRISAGISLNYGRDEFWQLILNAQGEAIGANDVNSISVTRGLSSVDRIGRAAISIGPSYVAGRRLRTDSWSSDVGIALNSQLILTPVKEVGIGFDVFANVNTFTSIIGARVSFVFEGNK